MIKVIFLDVDGVLNNGTWAIEMFDKGIRVYHDDLLYEPSLEQLKRIVDSTGAVIVVSSSWRQICWRWASSIPMSVEYFVVCTDEENDAYLVKGQYKTITGIVLKVDQHEQRITIRSGADTEVIPFSDIYRIFKPTG